jgi:8-oxo-dGTP pyrophosphatase MutT (NUDIX family)
VADAAPITRQVAALPIRRSPTSGRLEVLLVTSLRTGRWIVPKGWPIEDCSEADAVAQEAHEEAGVRGDIGPQRIGTYTYDKQRKKGLVTNVTVSVFLLQVREEEDDWPERDKRRREWLEPVEAASRVREPELKALILELEGSG